MAKRQIKPLKIKQDPRTEKVTILLSVEEQKMVDYFVKKYKHKSRSSILRKIIMTHILAKLNANYPTLFDQDLQ